MKKNVLTVIGTRPNFIKVTQFRKIAASFKNLELKIVHTGQHYDSKMADVFFEQFGLVPDYFLNISGGSPNFQVAQIMIQLEKLIESEFRPELIIVVGDVNSTLAASLTANKLGIKLAHIEAGLRSFDRTMPEEFNRILTDETADYFFVTESSGILNLQKEGKPADKIFFVGNTMIDTLVSFSNEIKISSVLEDLALTEKSYVLTTIHRPATVDTREGLEKLIQLIEMISLKLKIVFPIHPRTIQNLKKFNLFRHFEKNKNLIVSEPLDYFSFQKLVSASAFILTDSGGIQEESTYLGVPCLTLRNNTERPVTVSEGTNELVPFDLSIIEEKMKSIENGTFKKGTVPELWDGKATQRIFEKINEF